MRNLYIPIIILFLIKLKGYSQDTSKFVLKAFSYIDRQPPR